MIKDHNVQIKLRLAQLISQCNSVMSITPPTSEEWVEANKARLKLRNIWICVNNAYSDNEVKLYKCKCGNPVDAANDLCIVCYSKMIEVSKPDE